MKQGTACTLTRDLHKKNLMRQIQGNGNDDTRLVTRQQNKHFSGIAIVTGMTSKLGTTNMDMLLQGPFSPVKTH